jgi:hypothetical protein
MRIENAMEYFGAKEYARRLGNILADGSSFLRDDDLELFSASLRHELGQVQRAIQEYEASMLRTRLAVPRPAFTRIEIQGSSGLPEQPSVLQTWSQPWEHGGVVSRFQALRPQLRLFTVGTYTEEPSAVFGRSLEPVGLAA